VNLKQFSMYLYRDNERCYHCGISGPTLVPQHRIGRGMGGSVARNRSSNILTLCSIANGLLESDAKFASVGREYGWKLNTWQEPSEVPVFEIHTGLWWILTDDGTRILN
jgi:hypothetical protein